MTECCADCRYMTEHQEDDSTLLLCCRYPPAQIGMLEGAMTSWPVVESDDRCGEFSPREGSELERLRRRVDQLQAELNEARRQV